MTISITERTVGMWFMNLTDDSDFLAGLDATDEGFKLTWRFRYYAGPDPWDDKDKKNWYEMPITNVSKADAIGKVQALCRAMELKSGRQCDELLMRNGDVESFMVEFSQRKWAHARYEPLPEARPPKS